ncbi:MAG: DUF3859 domain-containing protein [Rhodobacterales bacterium]|nr:DUF3859 domain-containing protein [Rhodobacterales bacterium]
MKHITLPLLWLIFAFAAPALSQSRGIWFDETRIAEIEVGLICFVEVTGTEPAPDTILGEINRIANDPVINWYGTRVPAILGLTFGIKTRAVEGGDMMDVEILTHHPPFGPQNTTVERWSSDILAGDLTTRAFTFDFPYEMATGPWVFEAYDNGTLLYRVEFDVVPTAQAPLQSAICNGDAFMS